MYGNTHNPHEPKVYIKTHKSTKSVGLMEFYYALDLYLINKSTAIP